MGEFARNMGIAAVVTGIVFGGIWLHASKAREDRLANGEAELKSLLAASAGGVPVWVSLETQEFSTEDSDETVWRMSVYELETGKRLARRAEVPWHDCASAGDGRLWCTLPGGLVEVVTLHGLETKHSAEAIEAKLVHKMMDAHALRITDDGSLRTMLADGRTVTIHPDTLEQTPAMGDVRPQSAPQYERTSPFFGLRACPLPNSGRSGLCIGFDDRRDTGEGWLRPEVLVVPELKDRLLVLAKTSLDEAVTAQELWVLDEKLQPVTHRVLVPKSPSLVKQYWFEKTRTVVLGFGPPANETVAVDVGNGAERYRIRH